MIMLDENEIVQRDLTDRQSDRAARSSNIELLRIIAMLIIVAHHFSVRAGFSFGAETVTLPRLWVQFIAIGGKIGVNVFILISGYFLISMPKIKISRLARLWLQIEFYSVIIYFGFLLFGLEAFSIKTLIKMLFPVTFSIWWFASAYFVLYLISPFLNILLRSVDRSTFRKLLLLTFTMWCVFPTFTRRTFQSNDLLWFIFLYSVAAYIRLWHDKPLLPNRAYHAIAAGMTLLTFFSAVVLDLIGTKYAYASEKALAFYGMEQLPVFIVSLAMFLGFKGLNIGQSKLINTAASATFGVYLLHDNRYTRHLLWFDIFKNTSYSDTALIIPYSCAVIVAVYLVCTLVELLRSRTIEPLYMKYVNKADSYWEKLVQKITDRWK